MKISTQQNYHKLPEHIREMNTLYNALSNIQCSEFNAQSVEPVEMFLSFIFTNLFNVFDSPGSFSSIFIVFNSL